MPARGAEFSEGAPDLVFTTDDLFSIVHVRPPIHAGFAFPLLCGTFLKLWEAPAGATARWELRALARCSLRREEIDAIFGSWVTVEEVSVRELDAETVTTIQGRARPIFPHCLTFVREREGLQRLDWKLKGLRSDLAWLTVGIGPELIPLFLADSPEGQNVWPLVKGICLSSSEADPARFADLASFGSRLKDARKKILFTSVAPPPDDGTLRQVAALFHASVDLSFRVDLARRRETSGPGESREPHRPWGYYRPQPFDLCSPAPLDAMPSMTIWVVNPLPDAPGGPSKSPILEAIGNRSFLARVLRRLVPAGRRRRNAYLARMAAAIQLLVDSQAERFDRLLDYLRREKYLNEDIREKKNHRHYTSYCFYNESANSPRVDPALLLDGQIDLGDWSDALRKIEGRFRNIRFAGLFDPQRDPSAAAGPRPGRKDLFDEQIEAHDYLLENPARLNEVTQHLISLLPPRLGRCLDLGSGRGDLTAALAGRADRVVSFDLNLKFLVRSAAAEGRTLCVAGDMHALPFRHGAFQTVILDNVAEHSFAPLLLLAELRRILAPGGKCYLVVPLDGRIDAHAIPTHLWKLTLRGLRAALKQTGFARVDLREVSGYDLGMSGCFPTCNGTYGLAILEG